MKKWEEMGAGCVLTFLVPTDFKVKTVIIFISNLYVFHDTRSTGPILGKTKKFKGVSRHSQASMFVFADAQSEEPGKGSPAKEAQAPSHIPKEPLHQECSQLKRQPLRDLTSTNSPAAASSFDEPPSKKHLGAHEGTLPDLGLAIWDRDALDKDREARRRRMTETTANGFNKLNSAQSLAYFRRHETEDVLKVIFEHKERAAYETYFRNATDAAHNASIEETLGQPRSAAIAALALSHSVALYDSLDLILDSLGREKSCVPYTEAKTYDILKRLNDKAPALWINESVCAKGTHLANHASDVHPFYRKFMVEQETRFGHAFVVFDQARQILECSPQPGMPHHCKNAMAPSMWFFTNFGTTWVTRAGTEYELKVLGVSTIGGCLSKVGPYRTIDDMARQWGVQRAHIISVPHYDKSNGTNSGSAADMLELTLLKMAKLLEPHRAVDDERLRVLEDQHDAMKAKSSPAKTTEAREAREAAARKTEARRKARLDKTEQAIKAKAEAVAKAAEKRAPPTKGTKRKMHHGPCEHGVKYRSNCKVCSACPHGRRRRQCKDCGGASICEHGLQRPQCMDCGGSQICEHGRQRSQCMDCGGSQICEHGRRRSQCMDCGGSQICEHGRRRSQCMECGGTQICEHGRQRSKCMDCGGTSICEHGRQRSDCKECGGSSICEHGRRRTVCKECGGSSICEHGHQRSQCKECHAAKQ